MNLRYAADLFPTVPLPQPPMGRIRASLDGGLVRWRTDNELPERRLPTEFVFHELWDLDLADHHDQEPDTQGLRLVEFCNRFGPLPFAYGPPVDFSGGMEALRTSASLEGVNTVDDVKRWLLELRSATEYLAEVASVTDQQHRRFLAVLDMGLRRCPWGARPATLAGQRGFDLFTATALMLHSLTVDASPVRRCANDTCERPFVHQRRAGDDQRGHVRSKGVLYCTPKCAQAAARRAYKQRARASDPNVALPTETDASPATKDQT